MLPFRQPDRLRALRRLCRRVWRELRGVRQWKRQRPSVRLQRRAQLQFMLIERRLSRERAAMRHQLHPPEHERASHGGADMSRSCAHCLLRDHLSVLMLGVKP
jgi:hypothetical protein